MISEKKLRKKYEEQVDDYGKTYMSNFSHNANDKAIKAYELGEILEIPKKEIEENLRKSKSKWLKWYNEQMW